MLPVGPRFYQLLSQPELATRMADIAVATVTAIVSDNLRRMNECVQNKDLFWGGIFYGTEYFFKLQEAGFTQRPDFGVESGIFCHGMAPSSCFETIPDPKSATGIKWTTFVLKEGVTPTEGLKKIQEGPSLLDCNTVCQIGYLEALKEVLGPEKFDVLFSATGPNRLMIGGDATNNSFFGLIACIPLSQSVVKGERVYFKNMSDYEEYHPLENGRGYQTLCCDDTPGHEKFVTLGLPPDGLTKDEMVDQLIADYNETPMKPVHMRCKLAEQFNLLRANDEARWKVTNKKWTISTPEEIASFQTDGGGKIAHIDIWLMYRVVKLANTTAAEGQKLLEAWYEEDKQQLSSSLITN